MSRFFLTAIFLVASLVVICAQKRTCPTKCGINEECNPCGSLCEVECSRYPNKPCPKICNPPACVCQRGLYRDDNTKKCVPVNKCSVLPKTDTTDNNY